MNEEKGSTTSGTEVVEPTESTTGSEGGGSAPPGSGARRRRRRGGRGRGGRGGSGSGASTTDGVRPPDGTPAGEETSTATEQPEIDLDAQPGEVERSPATAPTGGTTRRRSRGGRGRGRSRGGTASTARLDETDVAASEGAVAEPATETADGGADGAAQAEVTPRTTTRRRRSRGGRGRGRAKPAGEGSEAGETGETGAAGEAGPEADGQEPARQRSTRPASGRTTTRRKTEPSKKADQPRRAKPGPQRSDEKAGKPAKQDEGEASAPTRLRRQRQGRTTVRRRRESMPVVPRVTDKLMVITQHGERDQIAVLEERELVQHYVTSAGARSAVGNVYLGRVQNVLPGMEAAFVDVGRGRNAVLYAGEVNWSPEDLEGAPPRIEHVLKSGQSVLVQVTKDPIGGKGARLTAQISLPGRFLVLAPNSDVSGISRRLPDAERRRLKPIIKSLKPGANGVIVRTAAEGASEEALADDLRRLLEEWEQIEKRAKKAKAPAVLYEEPELTVRVVRDLFTDEEYRELVTDSPRIFGLVTDYLRDVAPEVLSKVRLHEGPLSAFEEYHIVEQIHKGLDRKVWLPSGGYLVIDRTEAMTVIDVNTGKSVGKSNLEETVVNTNLEAAREVARQLRLRDIGGMIVIDFIDMLLEQNKSKVIDAMKESLAQDKSRSQVFDISPLGLLEVTRKRVSGGLLEAFSETCPTCEGRGVIITYDVD